MGRETCDIEPVPDGKIGLNFTHGVQWELIRGQGMPFSIDGVIPWGRTLAEYRAMFDLFFTAHSSI